MARYRGEGGQRYCTASQCVVLRCNVLRRHLRESEDVVGVSSAGTRELGNETVAELLGRHAAHMPRQIDVSALVHVHLIPWRVVGAVLPHYRVATRYDAAQQRAHLTATATALVASTRPENIFSFAAIACSLRGDPETAGHNIKHTCNRTRRIAYKHMWTKYTCGESALGVRVRPQSPKDGIGREESMLYCVATC